MAARRMDRRLPAGPAGEQAALELNHRRLLAALRGRWLLTADGSASGQLPTPATAADAEDALQQMLHGCRQRC